MTDQTKQKLMAMRGIAAKPLPPITPEQWEKFNGKQKWDLMSALRGPDYVPCSKLKGTDALNRMKWYSTSVIRGVLRNVIRVGGMVNTQTGIVIAPETYSTQEAHGGMGKAFNAGHFFGHIQDACCILQIPLIRLSSADYISFMAGSLHGETEPVHNALFGKGD